MHLQSYGKFMFMIFAESRQPSIKVSAKSAEVYLFQLRIGPNFEKGLFLVGFLRVMSST